MDSDLVELAAIIAVDRLGSACGQALRKLRIGRTPAPGRWRQALEVLVQVFEGFGSGEGLAVGPVKLPHRNLVLASSRIQALFLDAYAPGQDPWRDREQMEPYLVWLAAQPNYFLLQTLWRIYKSADANAAVWRMWHKSIVESGRLAESLGVESLKTGIELWHEGERIYFWPKKRWKGWDWLRDIAQYHALLADESPIVRAGSAFVLGRLYMGAYENRGASAVPPLLEMLAWVQSEEWRGTGVAGAFLSGVMFPIEPLLANTDGIDFSEWMFRTLAAGPEPEFTGFQSLAFHAHEYLVPNEENVRRLVFMGREDAALLLGTEEVNHDPGVEEQFRKNFAEWRARTLP
jgi:hypothetical protein